MQVLDRSAVEPTEIDDLGHMNVRYYQSRAQRAARALLGHFGLGEAAAEAAGAVLLSKDVYCRYQREQFRGAVITVRGGVLSADPEGVRVYCELANDDKGEIAATFIMVFSLESRSTRRVLPIPQAVLAAPRAETIALPPQGAPRTIDLSPPRLDLDYEELAERLSEEIADPMSRQTQRTIAAEDCDEHGFLAEGEDMMWGHIRSTARADERWGPMTFTTDEGHRFGWASLETRNLRLEQPRAGETICSIGAEIGLAAKVRHSRRWIFNLTTGRIVSLNDNVAIALDLDARRPIEIPRKLRMELDKRHLPEFA
ncbi:MAG TPA: thioesterase family protein [Phenylobacterium sp.]